MSEPYNYYEQGGNPKDFPINERNRNDRLANGLTVEQNFLANKNLGLTKDNPYIDIIQGDYDTYINPKPGMEELAKQWHNYNSYKTKPYDHIKSPDNTKLQMAKVLYNTLKKYQFKSINERKQQGLIYDENLDRTKDEDRFDNFKNELLFNAKKLDKGVESISRFQEYYKDVESYVNELISKENRIFMLKNDLIRKGMVKPKDVFQTKEQKKLLMPEFKKENIDWGD